MEVINKVVPNEAQIKGFMEPGHDGHDEFAGLPSFRRA